MGNAAETPFYPSIHTRGEPWFGPNALCNCPVLVDFCDPDKNMAGLPALHLGPLESHHHMAEAVLDDSLLNTKAAYVERSEHG